MNADGGNSTLVATAANILENTCDEWMSVWFRHFEWSLEFDFSSVSHRVMTMGAEREPTNGEWRKILIQLRYAAAKCSRNAIWKTVWMWEPSELSRDWNEHPADRERENEKAHDFLHEARTSLFHIYDTPYMLVHCNMPWKTLEFAISRLKCAVNRKADSVCRTYTCIEHIYTHTFEPKWKRTHQTVKYHKQSINAFSFSQMEYGGREMFFSFIKLLCIIIRYSVLFFYTINSCVGRAEQFNRFSYKMNFMQCTPTPVTNVWMLQFGDAMTTMEKWFRCRLQLEDVT